MKKKLLSLLAALTVLLTVLPLSALAEDPAAAEQEASGCRLEQVVILSRHNIRSPLTERGSVLDEITNHDWFAWTSNPGELSLRGAMLETTMGQYFRLFLEKEGLFPENYIPKDGAVRFYANGLQRTQATAHYFSTGLLPVAVVPVERHVEYNAPDNTFLPIITFMNDAYEQDVRDEIFQMGGGDGLSGYSASLRDAFELLISTADMEESEAYASGKYGNLLEDETVLNLNIGSEPTLSGPIRTMISVADAMVLQYYEEPDLLKATFGHELSEDDMRLIGSVCGTYEQILFNSPMLAVNLAHPILEEIYSELNTPYREFSFLCGHDSTISSLLAALGAEDYTLPNAIEPTTPIGCKLVFERWRNDDGKAFYKVSLVYQSVEQLRAIQPLSLEVPPMVVPLSFKGITAGEDGMIAEADLIALLRSKINEYYEQIDRYETIEEEAGEASEAA